MNHMVTSASISALEDHAMKSTKNSVVAASIALVLAIYPALALATPPIRHSSDLGEEGDVLTWNLFGPTNLISFPNLNLKMSTQVTCADQDVAASVPDQTNAGGCSTGGYQFLFQIPSGPDNLEVTFANLVNFTFNDDPNSSFTVGVMECDPPPPTGPTTPNTAVLCTTLGTDAASQIPDITYRHSGNSEVTFLIPNIPNYPAATCTPTPGTTACHQGQGLTLFVQMTAIPSPSVNVPIGFPTVKVRKRFLRD